MKNAVFNSGLYVTKTACGSCSFVFFVGRLH